MCCPGRTNSFWATSVKLPDASGRCAWAEHPTIGWRDHMAEVLARETDSCRQARLQAPAQRPSRDRCTESPRGCIRGSAAADTVGKRVRMGMPGVNCPAWMPFAVAGSIPRQVVAIPCKRTGIRDVAPKKSPALRRGSRCIEPATISSSCRSSSGPRDSSRDRTRRTCCCCTGRRYCRRPDSLRPCRASCWSGW